jgi:hypothetical protein
MFIKHTLAHNVQIFVIIYTQLRSPAPDGDDLFAYLNNFAEGGEWMLAYASVGVDTSQRVNSRAL